MSAALDLTLSALADPIRRRAVDRLRERPHRAGELAEALAISRPAMSRHLRVLRTRGLVSEASPPGDARARVYRLEPAPFRALSSWLGQVEAYWDDQLQAFEAHVRQRGDAGS